MRYAQEIIIVTMEALGMLLVSAGLGCLAGWAAGLALLGFGGLFGASGASLLGFATLAAFRQQAMAKPTKKNTGR